jgi:hypothetical protein
MSMGRVLGRLAMAVLVFFASGLSSVEAQCPPTQRPITTAPSGTITTTRPLFSWSAVPGAQSYTLYVMKVSNGAVVIRNGDLYGTSFTPTTPLKVGVDYYWKVKAESTCGAGPYSVILYFRIATACRPTIPPTSSWPTGTITNSKPTFSWTAVPCAEAYTLYVLPVVDGPWIVRAAGLSGLSFTPSTPLPTNTDMRWKVKAESVLGAGPYAPDLFFRVSSGCTPPTAPTGSSPSGTVLSTTPTFSWTAATGAQSYVLEADRADGTGRVLEQAGISSTVFTPTNVLPTGVNLLWRVKGINTCGAGPYSAQIAFRVDPFCPPPQAPTATAPKGAITDTTPAFSWAAASGAETYNLEVIGKSSGTLVLSQTGISGVSFTPVSALPTNADLQWRVAGVNTCGVGPSSVWVDFRITSSCPTIGVPVPQAPIGTVTSTRPTFTWTAAANATSYTLRVSKKNSDGTLIYAQGIATTSYTPTTTLPT